MEKRDKFDVKRIKKEQVDKIKQAIEIVVNDNKEYYKDKDYAKKFIDN